MEPPLALHALYYEITLAVGLGAGSAVGVRGARPALGVALLPVAVEARLAGTTGLALGAPLALPIALWHVVERRVHAINVVADVTVVTEYEPTFIVALTATLADRAVETTPAFLQYHFGHFYINAVRVIALTALGTGYETSFLVGANCPAHDTDVLWQDKFILGRA